MALADAIFNGQAVLEGIEAVRVDDLSLLHSLLDDPARIPVVLADFKKLMGVLRPQVLVDARMRKHSQPESQRELAPLTIGLGADFIAGETVHVAIAAGWDDNLGQVILHGPTKPLAGEPKSIARHSRDRYVYAPSAGEFETAFKIGDHVNQGEETARIGDNWQDAPIHGVLRGLTHTGVRVELETKVIEIDPRTTAPQISGIAERPRSIAEGVLRAVQSWEHTHAD